MGGFLLALALVFSIFFFIRIITVILHELGHALPVLIMTRKKVTVYIGSHGDQKKSFKISLGLLEIWLKYNPLKWQFGLCSPSGKNVSINQQLIYVLAGPLTSISIAITAFYYTFTYDLHGALKIVVALFLISSAIDFVFNLIPNSRPIQLYSGEFTYNDGYNIVRLLRSKKYPREYPKACKLYNEKKFSEAATLFEFSLSGNKKDRHLIEMTISSHVQNKNFERANELMKDFLLLGKTTSNDFATAAYIYSKLDLHDTAIEYYDKSLKLNAYNKLSLNNKGYTLNLLNRFEEAIPMFDRAIYIDPTFAYSYNNRGLAKIKLGNKEEGLKDIDHSLKLDPKNAYGYRNLGIYHLDKRERDEALKLFEKAKELDADTHMIDELITQAKQ